MKTILSIVLLTLATTVAAQQVPHAQSVPGGVVVLTLGDAGSGSGAPRAEFHDLRVMVIRQDAKWKAVIGLPLKLAPGEYHVSATLADGSRHSYPFTVVAKNYPTQYITLKNNRRVDLTKAELERYYRDVKQIKRAKDTWSNVATPPLRLQLPVRGGWISSEFGLRRFFNKQPRSPHAGIDLAVPVGTPVRAPAAGVVLETENFFFTGNTIFLDHGQGLITMYCHLSKFKVKPGERVQRGQIIAESGATGRVTGPHLHWSVILNHALVDPTDFLSPKALAALPTHRPEPVHTASAGS
jgi:murein DD-endopeptidase MepM/ murein hydrolase activator NlpD